MVTVSVIMPCWNSASFLEESVRSVEGQTLSDFELIIIDDCSTDDSYEIAKRLAGSDPRIKVYSTGSNKGPAGARNLGIKNATGKYIAFLDSDDLWTSKKLEEQIAFMEGHGYGFSYTEYQLLGDQAHVLTGPRKVTAKKMARWCYPGCLTVMYRRDLMPNLSVDESLKSRNDYAMWLKLSQKADCYLLKKNLAFYRVHQGSVSHSGLSKRIRDLLKMWRISEGKGILQAYFFLARNMFYGVLKKLFYKRRLSNPLPQSLDN